MDVLHVIHQFAPESHGGSESYLLDLVRRQRARGLDAQVLTGSKHVRERVVIERDEHAGIPVHRLHRDDLWFEHHAKMWHPDVEHAFGQLLAALQPKLVHVHHWLRLCCNLVEIAARRGIPAVVTLHDLYTSCPRAFRRRRGEGPDALACRRLLSAAECASCVPAFGHEPPRELATGVELFADHFRAELSLARAVLVATGSTADLLARTTGMPRARYEVLPFGYEARFAGLPPLPPPRAGEPLRFCYWGTIGRHKGVDVLVRAFARLHAERPGRAALHVLGEADSDDLARELRELAGDAAVTFHGAFDAAQLHAIAPHVGVFPSTCLETYGFVLDECRELGRPGIASDLGALGERGVVAGLLARAGDVDDLAGKLRRFVDEPGLWHELAALIPSRPLRRDEHVDALLAAYERARTGPAAPPHLAPFAPVTPLRRIRFLQLQRETALGRASAGRGPS
jgi:glycosyltransferase involved in cell wall biosynthesis